MSLDRVAAFRLTRSALCEGLQLGLRIEDVMRLLETASTSPLPQNVAFTLRDWAAQFESVRWLRTGSLLEAPDGATLDRWLTDPEVAAAIDRRIAPTLAVVLLDEPGSLRRRLRTLGAEVAVVDANHPLKPCATIQSPTTIVVDAREANLYAEAFVGSFADESDSGPGTSTYVITRESIQRAKVLGWSAERALGVLDAVTDAPVPPGTRLRVRGWFGEIAPIELGEVAVVVAPDADSFRDLRSDPELAPAFVDVISSTSGIVRGDAVDQLRHAFAERGITTRQYRPRGNGEPPQASG